MKPLEKYTLTLKHEYVDIDGRPLVLVDEPIVVTQIINHEFTYGASIVINDMFERMRQYMLRESERKEE